MKLHFLLCGCLSLVAYAASLQAEPFENKAAQKGLPEGPGLADAYAGDEGIGQNESVLFADNFEEGALGSHWEEVRNPSGNVLSYVDPASPGLGHRCLRVEAHLDKDTGGGLTRWFDSSSDTVFIRFYTKFDPACDYIHHFVSLTANRGLHGSDKWSGFGKAGIRPVGDDRFSTSIEPWGDNGTLPPPGRWNFYSYWPDMHIDPDGHYWGNSFSETRFPTIHRDQWICVEFMLKHNTPGQPDGEQAFWIDGVLQGHWVGIKWRTSPTLKANALTVQSYVTDRWTKNPVNTVFFDNIVIANKYIGPTGTK